MTFDDFEIAALIGMPKAHVGVRRGLPLLHQKRGHVEARADYRGADGTEFTTAATGIAIPSRETGLGTSTYTLLPNATNYRGDARTHTPNPRIGFRIMRARYAACSRTPDCG